MQMCVIVCVCVSVTMILIYIESIDTHVNRVHVWVCIFAKTCTTSTLAANTLSDPAAKQNAIPVWPSSISRRTIAQKSFNLAMQQHAEVFFHSRFLPPLDCNIIMPVQGNNSYSTDLWAKPGIRFKAVLSKLKKLIKYIYATMQIKHVRVCWDNVQQNFQTTVPLEILQSSSNSCLKTATFPPTVGRGSGGLGVPSQLLLWSRAGSLRSSTSASRPRRNIGCGGFRDSPCSDSLHAKICTDFESFTFRLLGITQWLALALRTWGQCCHERITSSSSERLTLEDSCPGTGLHDSIFVSIQTLNFCCDGFQNSTQGSSGISDGCQAVKWVWAAQEPTSAFLCPILPSPQHYEWLLCSRSRPGRPIFLRWRCRLSPS